MVICDPKHLRHIFQLRVGLSKLHSHKKRHNFHDTPSEEYLCNQGAEDSYHYFLKCSLYSIQRVILFTSINEILDRNNLEEPGNLIKLLLYGHKYLSNTEIKHILSASLEFIKNTKRFSNNN